MKGLEACQERFNLEIDVKWVDYFPGVINNDGCFEMIKNAASENELNVHLPQHPFKFGEDFGWFSHHFKTGMFGLGAGEDTPALHHADYDFPDALLETGIGLFREIIAQLLDG